MRPASRASLLIAVLASSQPAIARSDAQVWTGITANVRLGGPWRLSQELITRYGDRPSGLREVESNSLVGYAVTKRVVLGAGYSHHLFYVNGHRSALDRRLREQVVVDRLATFAGGVMQGRLRTEQRWRDGFHGAAWRVRPFLRYALPVGHKLQLVLSHEDFINLNVTAFQRRGGLERMRNFAGLAVPVSKVLTVEAGYLDQHLFTRGTQDVADHAASLSLVANF